MFLSLSSFLVLRLIVCLILLLIFFVIISFNSGFNMILLAAVFNICFNELTLERVLIGFLHFYLPQITLFFIIREVETVCNADVSFWLLMVVNSLDR